jgi:hypothetical protein
MSIPSPNSIQVEFGSSQDRLTLSEQPFDSVHSNVNPFKAVSDPRSDQDESENDD